jgi:hypothetical protein
MPSLLRNVKESKEALRTAVFSAVISTGFEEPCLAQSPVSCTFNHLEPYNNHGAGSLKNTLIKKETKFSSYTYNTIQMGSVVKSYIYEEGLPNI